MNEVFAIRDITSDILITENRPVKIVDDGNMIVIFKTYPEAMKKIETLPKGYYQIDKIFIQK